MGWGGAQRHAFRKKWDMNMKQFISILLYKRNFIIDYDTMTIDYVFIDVFSINMFRFVVVTLIVFLPCKYCTSFVSKYFC